MNQAEPHEGATTTQVGFQLQQNTVHNHYNIINVLKKAYKKIPCTLTERFVLLPQATAQLSN